MLIMPDLCVCERLTSVTPEATIQTLYSVNPKLLHTLVKEKKYIYAFLSVHEVCMLEHTYMYIRCSCRGVNEAVGGRKY